eukprot:3939302-Rhodomonas_salina.2
MKKKSARAESRLPSAARSGCDDAWRNAAGWGCSALRQAEHRGRSLSGRQVLGGESTSERSLTRGGRGWTRSQSQPEEEDQTSNQPAHVDYSMPAVSPSAHEGDCHASHRHRSEH